MQDIIEYLSTCQELGGVKGVDFTDCLDLSDPECKGYSSGGCSFTGTVLETLPGILGTYDEHLTVLMEP